MPRTAVVLIAACLALVAGGCSERPPVMGAEPVEARSARNVVVHGRASAVAPPRMATFVARVAVFGTRPDDAVREAELLARRLRGQLENLGVRPTDLVEVERHVEPRSLASHGGVLVLPLPAAAPPGGEGAADAVADAEPVLPTVGARGYLAVEGLQVSVRDQAELPRVLDRALTAGATELGPVSWVPNNPEALVERVRQRAVQDARAKAQVLAQELAQAVGQANSIVEVESVEPGDDPGNPYEARCEVRIDFSLRGF